MTATVATGMILTSAVGASANISSYSDCPSGNFCVWTGSGGSGTWWGSNTSEFNWDWGVANGENSAFNNGTSGLAVLVYDGGWYNDPHYCLKRGRKITLPSNKDNDGESHQWMSSTSAASQATCYG